MPGRSSLSPRPVRPSLPSQRFTVLQATKSLPLVRRIVRDIVETHEHALDLQTQMESTPADHSTGVQKSLDQAMDRLQSLVNELQDVGCELKDYRSGLIDFVGRHQGRDVYLCWKLGEEKISYWHELSAGFAGRKPISTLQETT